MWDVFQSLFSAEPVETEERAAAVRNDGAGQQALAEKPKGQGKQKAGLAIDQKLVAYHDRILGKWVLALVEREERDQVWIAYYPPGLNKPVRVKEHSTLLKPQSVVAGENAARTRLLELAKGVNQGVAASQPASSAVKAATESPAESVKSPSPRNSPKQASTKPRRLAASRSAPEVPKVSSSDPVSDEIRSIKKAFRSPNKPLKVIPSPVEVPRQPRGEPPRITAKQWRVRLALPRHQARWDVNELQFLGHCPHGRGLVTINPSMKEAICSGSSSDAKWGSSHAQNAAFAFDPEMRHKTGSSGWGGRRDDAGEVWIGAHWLEPVQVCGVRLEQGASGFLTARQVSAGVEAACAQAVFLEARTARDGPWGLVAGPVRLHQKGPTTVKLRSGHPLSPEPGHSTPSEGLRTPRRRIANAEPAQARAAQAPDPEALESARESATARARRSLKSAAATALAVQQKPSSRRSAVTFEQPGASQEFHFFRSLM